MKGAKMLSSMSDGTGPDIIGEVVTEDLTLVHVEPDVIRGRGFLPHDGENRQTRRAGVANFTHEGHPKLRRELLEQRQRHARGKLSRKAKR